MVDINNLPDHITYYEREVTRKSGVINIERSIRVFLKIIKNGKKDRISRTISVNKNGLEVAVDTAVKWIEEQSLVCIILSPPPKITSSEVNWDEVNKRYIYRGSSIIIRVPGADSKAFNNGMPREAIAYRDKLCAELGIDIKTGKKPKKRALFAKKKPNTVKKNKKLSVGIYYSECRRIDIYGIASTSRAYRSSANIPDPITGKIKKMNFSRSANRYGHKEALRLVTEWRNERVSKHYQKS